MALAAIFMLAACSTPQPKPPAPLEFDIHWREGEPTLRSTHLPQDFAEHTPYGPYAPEVVLLLVPGKGTPEEDLQNQELDKVDSEARTYIQVIADLSSERKGWYYVDVETAERLFQGRSNGFHVLLLDSSGRLLLESDEVIPAEVVREYFPIDTEYKGP